MLKLIFRWTLVSGIIIITAAAGCKQGEDQPDDPEAGADKPTEVVMAEALWMEAQDYRDWTVHSDAPIPGQEPHGSYIHLFYNDTTKAAIGGEGAWPDDAILVKDNFSANEAGDGPGELEAITMMKKTNGTWFWAKYRPDGSLFETPEGMAVAGTENLGCIDCHASAEQRDHVITELTP